MVSGPTISGYLKVIDRFYIPGALVVGVSVGAVGIDKRKKGEKEQEIERVVVLIPRESGGRFVHASCLI